MILDLRFNILDKYVHKFVIVENLFMHSGKKKKKTGGKKKKGKGQKGGQSKKPPKEKLPPWPLPKVNLDIKSDHEESVFVIDAIGDLLEKNQTIQLLI